MPSYLQLRLRDRRLISTAVGIVVLLALLGGAGLLLRHGSAMEDPFYTPGVTPKREDCVLARMKAYNRLNKQTLTNIAAECELTVQSIEGHESLRKAWEARQAMRDTEVKPAEPANAPPAEADRLRRVWN